MTLSGEEEGVGRIPVRNIWLLFLYASGLARLQDQYEAEVEATPDFPSLIARLLCHAVEKRMRRNLSRGYRSREAVLTRVRGRIDLLRTHANDLLAKGAVACRFDEHTFDTPRNRLVRAALDALAGWVDDDLLAHDCRRLARSLGEQGVSGSLPSRGEISADRIGRHDADDQMMVSLARLVFDLVLPTEQSGQHTLARVEKDAQLVRKLFEKAVGNFLAVELPPDEGWQVFQGKRLNWQIEAQSQRIPEIMPGMQTDIILESLQQWRRIIIDTKFTGIFTGTEYKSSLLKSGYIYQLYAYLRSQEAADDPLSNETEGILLHPAIDVDVDESVVIQGHRMRFLTVDLARPSDEIIEQLRKVSDSPETVFRPKVKTARPESRQLSQE
ncbi:MAG: 5-methylcytosine-specific restriction endonuclease system specificity protein McrC [Pseudomonadota bacterium]